MAKIYNDVNDRNVAVTMIYTTNGKKYFYDEAKTAEVNFKTDGFNLFVKGVIANKGGVLAAATSCSATGVITFAFPA